MQAVLHEVVSMGSESAGLHAVKVNQLGCMQVVSTGAKAPCGISDKVQWLHRVSEREGVTGHEASIE